MAGTIPRADLVRRLAQGLPDDTVSFGSGVEAVSLHGDEVEITLTSGEHLTPEVAVGADGHRSIVRREVLDPEPATDSGWATWQGVTIPLHATALVHAHPEGDQAALDDLVATGVSLTGELPGDSTVKVRQLTARRR